MSAPTITSSTIDRASAWMIAGALAFAIMGTLRAQSAHLETNIRRECQLEGRGRPAPIDAAQVQAVKTWRKERTA